MSITQTRDFVGKRGELDRVEERYIFKQ